MKDILFKLASAHFIGSERTAAADAVSMLDKVCDSVYTDESGSVFAVINGKTDRRLLLTAHIDQIGFAVTNILDGGFLRMSCVGGVDVRTLPSSKIKIFGKQTVSGVFTSTPPHLAGADADKGFPSVDELFADTSRDDAPDVISVGDFAVFDIPPAELTNGFVTSPALDDRAGCAALIQTAARLHNKKIKPLCTVYILLASGEELGNRGAKTASFAVNPDEAVAVDVSFASTPMSPKNKCGECKKGAMLGISPVLSKRVTELLEGCAKKYKIPYQYEIMSGKTGTDADIIALNGQGVACGLLSIPLRYMHTPVEAAAISDIEAVSDILFAYVTEDE